MTVDPQKQAALVESLRKAAEDAAARNPAIGEVRAAAKPLVDEIRRRKQSAIQSFVLASYLSLEGAVCFLEADDSGDERGEPGLFAKLAVLAKEGKIRAAAVGTVIAGPSPSHPTTMAEFIQVHSEHISGLAARSLAPVDPTLLQGGVSGVAGPAVALMSGKAEPRIFPRPA
jgi:hypothetical protein